MPDNGSEIRSIAWTAVFPFFRLFKTFALARHFPPMLFGLASVVLCCLGGWILDRVWVAADRGVPVQPGTRQTEIEVYATHPASELSAWRTDVYDSRQGQLIRALRAVGKAQDEEAARRLARHGTRELLALPHHEDNVKAALVQIDERLTVGLDRLRANTNLSDAERKSRERALRQSADHLRLVLTGHDLEKLGVGGDLARVIESFDSLAAPATTQPTSQAALPPATQPSTPPLLPAELVERTVLAQATLNSVHQSAPVGPFTALLRYEMHCFSAAIRGACTFRWGFSGSAMDPQPALMGSIASAGSGVVWLLTQHTWFLIIYSLWHFAIFALFGGAICRHAAVQSARDECISTAEAFRFAREKYLGGLLPAALFPPIVFLGIAILLYVGGLIGAIPWIGTLLAGILYFLALLGGVALTAIMIATVLGLHLTWPTIAVEGSEAFDGITRAFGSVTQRPWNLGFYTLFLLLYGAVSFVMVRIIALMVLKLTHLFTNAGMSWCGSWHSAHTATISKLNAMWHMPSWGDLSLLPALGDTPFWGTFNNAPLSGTEWVAMVLIWIWVHLVVALVGAFVVSFFFCGSTQMYFLLRRDVDGVDYDEIFYEEPIDELAEPQTAAATASPETPSVSGPAGDAGAAVPPPEPTPPPPPTEPPPGSPDAPPGGQPAP